MSDFEQPIVYRAERPEEQQLAILGNLESETLLNIGSGAPVAKRAHHSYTTEVRLIKVR